ncbi:MAG TPA: TraB/GumN family protein [Rhodocyclaceae bacterium]|nr:TraB/GumN family protein [Rhodocyclaceae bacterium]
MKSRLIQIGLRAGACWLFVLFAAAAQATDQRLSLWEVRGPHATVYLFGSIHACKPSCYPLPTSVLKHFDASSTLALELDPTRVEGQTKITEAATLPPGESLESKLSAQDLKDLRSVLADLGLPEEVVFRFRPWMVSTLISLTALQKQGFSVDEGIDLWLLSRAKAENKSIVELETIDRQIAALTAGTERDQIDALRETLDMFQRHRVGPYFEEMISAWQRGDGKKIEALVEEDQGSDKSSDVELLDRRNEEMAVKIAQWLQQGDSSFVTVGVAHLVGPHNIGELLSRQGYKVRQLREGE